jgi:hypothetical protein
LFNIARERVFFSFPFEMLFASSHNDEEDELDDRLVSDPDEDELVSEFFECTKWM